jgi:hypothetical protein
MEEAFAQGFSALSKSAFVATLLAGLAAGAFYSGSPVYSDGGCGGCNIEQPVLVRNLLMIYLKPLSP